MVLTALMGVIETESPFDNPAGDKAGPLGGELRTKEGVCRTESSLRWSPSPIIDADALDEPIGRDDGCDPGDTLWSLSNLLPSMVDARISCQPHEIQIKTQPRRYIINTQLKDVEQSAYLRDFGGTCTGFLEPCGIAWEGDTLSDAYFE